MKLLNKCFKVYFIFGIMKPHLVGIVFWPRGLTRRSLEWQFNKVFLILLPLFILLHLLKMWQPKWLKIPCYTTLVHSIVHDKRFSTTWYSDNWYSDKRFSTTWYSDKRFSTTWHSDKQFSTTWHSDKRFSTTWYSDKRFSTTWHSDKRFSTTWYSLFWW